MKLLFYIHGISGGGAERVMSTLMNRFVGQGHQVRVVYTESLEPPVYSLAPQIEQVYMQSRCPMKSKSIVAKIFRRIWKYSAIRKQAKKYKPDFVISFLKAQNNDVLAALLGTGYPVIIGDHTNVDRKYPWQTSLLSNILYPYASGITMLTMRDYEKWKNKYRHVYYVPNPCDIKQKHIGAERRKIVLGVGRVNQWHIKGFDSLIKAWHQVHEKHPDWKCQIAGAYSESSLLAIQKEVGIKAFEDVEFIGFRSDIHDYMESCEIFCLSSRIEGMPMVLLEALNLGCACVAFDCVTGPAEMIDEGKTGLLAKNQDVDNLAAKLEQVISDEELRKAFHENAPMSVDRFSTENVLNAWNQMFNDLKK